MRIKSRLASALRSRLRRPRRLLHRAIVLPARRIIVLPARRFWLRDIPIAMVTGTKGKTTTTRMLAHILSEADYCVGVATTDGIIIGGRTIQKWDSSGYGDHARVLNDPFITAAVLETARGGLKKEGLYIDRCNVAALLNVGREQIGIDGIDTLEQMAALKRRVVDAARGTIVLNADDPLVGKMIPEYPVNRTTVFSFSREADAAVCHRRSGGIAYCLEESGGARIVRMHGDEVRTIISVADLPSAWGGIVRHNIANAMAAAAMAEGLGIKLERIRSSLASFHNTTAQSPGRFIVIEDYSFLLILDHVRSPPSAQALVECLRRLTAAGCRRCMLETMGDRPDWHYREFTAILADSFDHFVCYEQEKYRRGRAPGEIANLLKCGLLSAGVSSNSIEIASDYASALRTLSASAKPKDLLVVLGSPEREDISLIRKAFSQHSADT